MHETPHSGGGGSDLAAAAARPGVDGVAGSAGPDWRAAEDRDRIAAEINDVVVRRLYSAGLALQSAMALLDGHRAGASVQQAIGELDRAIIDLRGSVFGIRRPDSPDGGKAG